MESIVRVLFSRYIKNLAYPHLGHQVQFEVEDKSVSVSNMLPGDVVCYSGHVAIYIGNNKIVHASNSSPYPKGGIKISSPADYRTILAVRRYW